jgi:2-desacetyl-2-hydroxyethyl bacteriochlorophyllide A dehydrogenase
MRAAVAHGLGTLDIEVVPDPAPGPGQVVIEVESCGVCGTDVHVVDGDYPIRYPVVPGHEFAGTIVAAARDVTHVRDGDYVVVDPMIFCGHCPRCQAGWTNQCVDGGGLGTTAPGAFADLVAVQADRCVLVPPDLPRHWAPLAEPLACVVHAVDRIGPVMGRTALVIGAGPSGLMMTALLERAGARVDVAEHKQARRHHAASFGASRVGARVEDLDQPGGWDVVVDVTGSVQGIEEALASVARAGHVHIYGVARPEDRVQLSPYDLFSREITITGSTSVLRSFGRAVDLLTRGALPADLLVDAPTSLDEASDAVMRAKAGQVLKAFVSPGVSARQVSAA